jgi:thioredoxin-dependent adenylylsulfate APS reductase
MTAAALEELTAQELLQWALSSWGDRFAVVTSFQSEGMVLVDMAARLQPGVRVITLDTGRLPQETYDMMATVRERYPIRLETVLPEPAEVERMVSLHGPNLFRESVAHRRACCEIRKVRPLDRKLAGVDAYAVGLRRGQNDTRAGVPKVAESGGKQKLSPLADWSKAQIAEYIEANNVPVHPLYASGYTSIGCGPCTRATTAGEDERAGRWWWEQDAASECGLHFRADGTVERSVDVLVREILSD